MAQLGCFITMPSDADASLLVPAHDTINATDFEQLSPTQWKVFFDRLCKFYKNPATKNNTLLYCYRKSALELLHFAVVADHVEAVDMLFEVVGCWDPHSLKYPTDAAALTGNEKLVLHIMTEYGVGSYTRQRTSVDALLQQSPQHLYKARLKPYRKQVAGLLETVLARDITAIVLEYYLPDPAELIEFQSLFLHLTFRTNLGRIFN